MVVVMTNTTRQDKGQADRYLTLLDEGSNAFTFQTFDDNSDRKNSGLARILHGSLDENWDQLVALNDAGAGVFVTINETDLKGRKVGNIKRVRAIWQEAEFDPIRRKDGYHVLLGFMSTAAEFSTRSPCSPDQNEHKESTTYAPISGEHWKSGERDEGDEHIENLPAGDEVCSDTGGSHPEVDIEPGFEEMHL
jgi:hypothetical protein